MVMIHRDCHKFAYLEVDDSHSGKSSFEDVLNLEEKNDEALFQYSRESVHAQILQNGLEREYLNCEQRRSYCRKMFFYIEHMHEIVTTF